MTTVYLLIYIIGVILAVGRCNASLKEVEPLGSLPMVNRLRFVLVVLVGLCSWGAVIQGVIIKFMLDEKRWFDWTW